MYSCMYSCMYMHIYLSLSLSLSLYLPLSIYLSMNSEAVSTSQLRLAEMREREHKANLRERELTAEVQDLVSEATSARSLPLFRSAHLIHSCIHSCVLIHIGRTRSSSKRRWRKPARSWPRYLDIYISICMYLYMCVCVCV